MDILTRILDTIKAELGDDIFTEEKRQLFEQQFRFEYGSEAHYVASLHTYEVQQRHLEVRKLIEKGLTDVEIAERIGIARGHAWRLRQRLSPVSP